MKKKIMSVLLVMAMIGTMTACSSSSSSETTTEAAADTTEAATEAADAGESSEETTAEEADSEETSATLSTSYAFDAGSSGADGTTIDKIMKYFVSEAEEQSDGQVTISYYGASQLGGDSDLLTSCLAGEVPFVIMNTSNVVSAVPELAVFDMAGSISSSEVMAAVMEDPEFSETIQGWFEAAGLHLCFYCPSVYKWLISTKEINSIDDLQGYTMRTLANEYQMALWEGAGASVVQITATELYLSIQQGMVDGCEMDLAGLLNFDLPEVTNYLYETRMYPHVSVCVMNLDLWNEMSAEDQAWFDSFFADINEYYEELGTSDDELSLEGIEADGVAIQDFNEDLFNDLSAIAEEVVYPMVRENIGDEPVDAYLAAIENAESSVN